MIYFKNIITADIKKIVRKLIQENIIIFPANTTNQKAEYTYLTNIIH